MSRIPIGRRLRRGLSAITLVALLNSFPLYGQSPSPSLPEGSQIIESGAPLVQASAWDSYRWYIVGGFALIAGQTLLIFEMLWLRVRRRRVENDLVISNDRLRLAMEGGGFVGWDWNVKTGEDYWFGDLPTMFGISSSQFSGRVEDFHKRVHPEDRERVGKAVAEARQSRKPYAAEFRVVRPDGVVRWITARGQFSYAPDGDALRMRGMAVDTTERKQIEELLKKSEEKFCKTFQQSPMCLAITRVRDNRYMEVNDTFLEVSGLKRDEVIGRTPAEVGIWVDPEARPALEKRLLAGEVVRNLEFRAHAKGGAYRTALGSAELIEIAGEPCILIVSADITDLKRAEATLRESEERFRLVANTAPVMIWMTGPDKSCTYVNKRWLEFTGRSFEQEMGDGWVDSIHPEDQERCYQTYANAFSQHQVCQIEYRLRRHDGEYRWAFDSGVPRYNADGAFAGYIGTVIDVSERKLAEEALSNLSSRLIEAQEEERSWIARELHDDISQRLVSLRLNLENLHKFVQNASPEFEEGFRKVIQQSSNLNRDIGALSHRLHSSNLKYLGLGAAAQGYCRELAEQHRIDIELESDGIPDDLPQEISLCLFRVLQEALQNAIKHSGSQKFEVNLGSRSNEVILKVRDSGIGFDPVKARRGRGLGLTSMRERLKLVDGELWIESRHQVGTSIHVRVPVKSRAASAVAG